MYAQQILSEGRAYLSGSSASVVVRNDPGHRGMHRRIQLHIEADLVCDTDSDKIDILLVWNISDGIFIEPEEFQVTRFSFIVIVVRLITILYRKTYSKPKNYWQGYKAFTYIPSFAMRIPSHWLRPRVRY
jgi:hypothetical protein